MAEASGFYPAGCHHLTNFIHPRLLYPSWMAAAALCETGISNAGDCLIYRRYSGRRGVQHHAQCHEARVLRGVCPIAEAGLSGFADYDLLPVFGSDGGCLQPHDHLSDRRLSSGSGVHHPAGMEKSHSFTG